MKQTKVVRKGNQNADLWRNSPGFLWGTVMGQEGEAELVLAEAEHPGDRRNGEPGSPGPTESLGLIIGIGDKSVRHGEVHKPHLSVHGGGEQIYLSAVSFHQVEAGGLDIHAF